MKRAFLFSSLCSNTYTQSLPYLEQANFASTNDTAILMMNLGGPNSKDEISPFLIRFFTDSTVIRIPFGLGPYIAKLRGPYKINKQYEQIGGYSPLLQWTHKQGQAMSKPEGAGYLPAFRYGLPLQEDAIEYVFEKTEGRIKKFLLFSQYPQYSCSTGGNAIRTAIQLLEQYKNKKYGDFEVQVVDSWHTNQHYIRALAEIIKEDLKTNQFDVNNTVILFTAHSLPLSFVQDGEMYPYYIYETCTLIQKYLSELNINIEFKLSFQSRVGFNEWVKPTTTEMLHKLSKTKNVLLSPVGFTSDHLETLYELDLELIPHVKSEHKIVRGRSLNDNPLFTNALSEILKSTTKGRRERCVNCKFEECDIVNKHNL